MSAVEATIEERGNGLPTAGYYVPGDDGNLYLVARIISPIETAQGRANWVRAELIAADWEDCAEEDEFPALAIVGGAQS